MIRDILTIKSKLFYLSIVNCKTQHNHFHLIWIYFVRNIFIVFHFFDLLQDFQIFFSEKSIQIRYIIIRWTSKWSVDIFHKQILILTLFMMDFINIFWSFSLNGLWKREENITVYDIDRYQSPIVIWKKEKKRSYPFYMSQMI